MADRPLDFRVNYGHPLASGLVFAGLGRHANSTHYRDSSLYGNHGLLTNMEPATDWVWGNELGRWALDFDGVNENIIIPNPSVSLTGDLTVAGWIFVPLVPVGLVWSKLYLREFEWRILESNDRAIWYHGDGSNYDQLTWNVTWSRTSWTSVVFVRNTASATVELFLNGISQTAKSYIRTPSSAGGVIAIGSRNNNSSYCNVDHSDVMIHNRALSLPEIQQLADRSNVMLSGLLLPPRRRLFGAVTAAPAGFKAAWATRQRRLIGSGGVL